MTATLRSAVRSRGLVAAFMLVSPCSATVQAQQPAQVATAPSRLPTMMAQLQADPAQPETCPAAASHSIVDGITWYQRPSAAGRQSAEQNEYIVAARRIGAWLQSLETDAALVPDDALRPGASASLGEGAAGVALFLNELYLATRDPEDARVAAHAADRLIDLLPEAMVHDGFPPRTSLYLGAPGLATTLLRLHATTGDGRHLAAVREVAAWLLAEAGPEGHAGWTEFNDILFGDAGTALFLLDVAQAMDDDAALARAVAVGRSLIDRARREHGGLYWVLRESADSNLPNFSHGAAGVGYLLARLYEETRDTAFIEAAVGAATYLEAIARIDDKGGLAVPYGFGQPEWRDRYELGWGHGVSGTARFYEQLARVTGGAQWRERVEAAARAVHAADLPGAYSLDRRFGLAGIADFELDLAGRDAMSEDLAPARALADLILARATRTGTGLYWNQPRPVFMTDPGAPGALSGFLHGAAGVGLFLLRLDAALRGRPWTLRLPDTPW